MSWLLLHGFTGTPESFSPLRSRSPSLKDSLVPALAGHLDAPISVGFWQEVDRLAALAKGCDQLFGYSLGGRLALGLLARYPARFRYAVVASAQPGLESEQERATRRSSDHELVRLLRERGLAAFVSAWEAQPLWSSQSDLAAVTLEQQRLERLRHDPERLALSLLHQGLAEMPDLRPLLARVQSPVAVMVGERDAKFTALGRELCSLMPSAELTIAPGAGHNLLLESSELCAARLVEGKPS